MRFNIQVDPTLATIQVAPVQHVITLNHERGDVVLLSRSVDYFAAFEMELQRNGFDPNIVIISGPCLFLETGMIVTKGEISMGNHDFVMMLRAFRDEVQAYYLDKKLNECEKKFYGQNDEDDKEDSDQENSFMMMMPSQLPRFLYQLQQNSMQPIESFEQQNIVPLQPFEPIPKSGFGSKLRKQAIRLFKK